jgi:nucleoside-diphosphate kinase
MNDQIQKMVSERTLVLFKPDTLLRGLSGEILTRLERTGLKMVACKMVLPTRELLNGHFPNNEDWIRGMGEKSLETYQELGIDPVEALGTSDSLEIGKRILEWNYAYLSMGPVLAIVFEGIHAVASVRKIIGSTLPFKALPGTIRGDFSINAPDLANVVGSACKNMIHASGNLEEAEAEIKNWFKADEIINWEKPADYMHFLQGEFTK